MNRFSQRKPVNRQIVMLRYDSGSDYPVRYVRSGRGSTARHFWYVERWDGKIEATFECRPGDEWRTK